MRTATAQIRVYTSRRTDRSLIDLGTFNGKGSPLHKNGFFMQ